MRVAQTAQTIIHLHCIPALAFCVCSSFSETSDTATGAGFADTRAPRHAGLPAPAAPHGSARAPGARRVRRGAAGRPRPRPARHDALADLILPGMMHWQSPRHFAHFPATGSNVGALGEALAAGINVVSFTLAASPAATELKMVVVDWPGKALHLPAVPRRRRGHAPGHLMRGQPLRPRRHA
jgi:hypothetical protein